MFPLTKSMHPKVDYPELHEEIAWLHAQLPDALLATQHEQRIWEYALALRAIRLWWLEYTQDDPANTGDDCLTWWDVGGGGSPFGLLRIVPGIRRAVVIDPTPPCDPHRELLHVPTTLEDLYGDLLGAAGRPHMLTSLSVVEHITFPTPFLRRAVELLRPGGLLFLTMDGWGAEGEDTAHFHWMRRRIYNPKMWRELVAQLHRLGLERFGGVDWTYRGDFVYDYSFLSVSMRKPMLVAGPVPVPEETPHA